MATLIPDLKQKIYKTFDENIEFTSTRRSKIVGLVFAVVLLLLVIVNHQAFTSLELKSKWLLLSLAMIIPFIVGLTAAYSINLKNDKVKRACHIILLLLMPIPTITMSEALNKVFIYDMTYLGFFGNYVLIILLYFLIYAVSGSIKWPIIIVNPIIFGFALANAYLMEFRGTPFIPMDFLAIKTAAGVAGTYNFSFTYNMHLAAMIFIWIMIVGIKVKTPSYPLVTRASMRTFAGTFFAVIMILFYATPFFANLGVKPDFWNQTRGYRNYGFALMFFCNTKYLFMSEPNGYDANLVDEYVNHIVEKPNEDKPNGQKKPTPNIICIMNESLSDLSVLGEFTTNADYMPFMRSLTENTVKGTLYVPVIGAGTSNTEFEFITGHTTAFLPSGSNAYMLYIKEPMASLVSTLEAQNYSSYTLHPYYKGGWNRVSVYENLGFNMFTALEDMIYPDILSEYVQNASDPELLQGVVDKYYPGSNMLLRQYINDSYNYKTLIEDFENRDKTKPYFAFNVTMQNHGGYSLPASNFNEEIYVTSSQFVYPKTNRYLSLVKRSDDAFRDLIAYFSKVKQPTVICMFGDHQPSIEKDFIAEALGVESLSSLTLEQEQARHATPFFIWANYDIEEKEYDMLSSNYLSSLVLKTAGVELTSYNQYLLKLMEQLPVISTVGYIDADGVNYRWGAESPYTEILKEYEHIQYNNIFDRDNNETDIFYINGFTSEDIKPSQSQEDLEEAS